MQRVNPERALSTLQRSEHNASSAAGKTATPAALTRVWLAAIGLWGAKWTSHFGELPVDDDGRWTLCGAMWAKGLGEFSERTLLSVMDDFIRAGDEWPPNLPQMRRRCAGVPDFEAVNHELLTIDTAHRSAFARLTWSFIDGYQHRHARAEDAKRMRRDAYERAAEHVLQGGALPGPVAGELQHQEPLVPAGIPAKREDRIAKLQSLLGENFNPTAASRTIDELNASEARREAHRVPRIEEL